MHRIFRIFLIVADDFPVIGTTFWRAGLSAHWEAAKEWFSVILISTSPIWIGAVALLATNGSPHKTWDDYTTVLGDLLKNGELFLYCTSIIATISWLCLKEWANQFPDRLWYGVLSVVGFALSVVFFVNQVYGINSDRYFVLSFSKYVYIFSLFLYYAISVVNNASPPNIKEIRDRRASRFSDQLHKHRGNN